MANFSIVVVPTKKLSNGRHRIRIAVAHHSQTRYISTQFTLDSANQLKNGRVVRHENAANMNACLRKLINEYEEIVTSISYLPAISCTELIHIITYEQKKKGITFQAVAKEYNTALIEVLTGFKYIGEQIHLFDETGSHHYVFGLEESYGCLAGTYARDKDAPVAVMMLCEVAAYYKLQGKTLWDAMVELYEKYGYYKEDLATVTLKGIDGSQKITAMMNAFRENPPKELGGFKVLACRDYKSDCRRDMITGETTSTGLPTSNVLYYELENNAWCCVRPSGTEPKIKYYFGVKGENFKDAEEKLEALKKAMTE